MFQSKYRVVVALVAAMALSGTAVAKKSSKTPAPRRAEAAGPNAVTLEIAGPADPEAVSAYQKAFAASGLTAKIHESKKGNKALRVVASVDKSTDLKPFGKAIMTAVPTKPGQTAPALEVLIYATLTKETSQQAMGKLGAVKGVDAKHSTVDVKKGSLRVRITGAEPVTAEEILTAVESAGVAPKLAPLGHSKKS